MAMSKNHQGVIAFSTPIESHSLEHILQKKADEGKAGLVVVIPEALYEYNLGAIIRTCECAGVDAVVINKRINLGVGVGRASMGAIEYVPIVTQNIHSSLAMLREYGYKIYAAEAGVEKNYYDTDLTGSTAIIIGSEDKGISVTTGKYVDDYINIPMLGNITSLNMSVAGAVILYEAVRQRLTQKL
jgi:23S rRNA (guanosine2251-2'-O)-methyltransferase